MPSPCASTSAGRGCLDCAVSRRGERAARVLPVCATTVPPPPPSRPHLRRRRPSPGAGPRFSLPLITSSFRRRTSSSCSPPLPASSVASSRSLSTGAGSSASFGAEREPEPLGVGGRLAERDRPPPRGAADEPRPEGELSRRAPRALGSGEQAVDEHAEPSPERQLLADCIRELAASRRDGDAGCRGVNASVLLAPRQAPGAPAVRPQSFGNGATRQPGKLSDRSHSELLELLVALPLEREQGQRQRGEERARAVVGDDQRLPRPRHARRRERREPPLGGPGAGVPRGPDGRERPLERRLEPAVEPLDALRVEERRARLGRLDREPRVLEPRSDLLPGLLDPGRVLLDERRAPGRWRAPPPAASPASRLSPAPPASPSRPAPPFPAAAPAPPALPRAPAAAAGGCPEVEGRDDDSGDHGTYVLHEHTFSCQGPGTSPPVVAMTPADEQPERETACGREQGHGQPCFQTASPATREAGSHPQWIRSRHSGP